ncbi:amino acid permease/ SLC12A domain-containing protein [Crucibulum laeve]|uniref:Amino acid permease/ SLC12A domain-containing protein n=1 Tax=Crucibulum laeve TaxID=68775 RepID=A0A5C3LLU0_9AGAR|nr:amino acid permease/ SLC12A domain-containing protein [Crucibulum laeve]
MDAPPEAILLRRVNPSQQQQPQVVPHVTTEARSPTSERRRLLFQRARTRIELYQERWGRVGEQLPPQINRKHISVISIGGVIGTGLYIGTATALRHAGPVGTLIGYIITGTVVLSVVQSIGEIVAFLPNVGGPVGIAGLYVDPALGFALGWNAWYNWTIILPTELSAAAILVNGFFPNKDADFLKKVDLICISAFLVAAIGINCFGSRAYGEAEFFFSCIKITTIIGLIIAGIVLDAGGGGTEPIGFRYWRNPGPFVEYRAKGNLGKFLGVWSSTSQAVFAFFGTEVPGVAAGEVQNPTKNIPRAVKRIWIRITLFYVLAVFVAGLLVPSDDPRLKPSPTSDNQGSNLVSTSPFVIAMINSRVKHLDKICNGAFVLSAFSAAVSDVYISSRYLFFLAQCGHAPRFCAAIYRSRRHLTVIPWVGLVVASGFAFLAFMSSSNAEEAFHWLSSMNSTTALLSWIGMLVTYIRWYQGTQREQKKNPNFYNDNWETLFKNRHWAQPWIAIYALFMCVNILIFNGWFVFTRSGPWRIAVGVNDPPMPIDEDIGGWVPTFISSYLALPLFVLLFLGYKLVYRTQIVHLENMVFTQGNITEIHEERPTTRLGKMLAVLF